MRKFIIAMICALVAVLPAVAQDMNSKGDNIVGEYLLSSTSKQATRMPNPLKVKNHIFNNDSFVATVDASRWWSIFCLAAASKRYYAAPGRWRFVRLLYLCAKTTFLKHDIALLPRNYQRLQPRLRVLP